MLIPEEDWMQAAVNGDVAFFRKAVASGNAFEKGMNRLSLLRKAAIHGQIEICQFLIDSGARIDDPDVNDGTALSAAASRGRLELCRLLVAAGAKVDYRPEEPETDFLTPFQWSVRRGRGSVVRYFLEECKQDIDQKTVDGRTMFDLAQHEPASMNELLSWRTKLALQGVMPDTEENSSSVSRAPKSSLSPL